MTTIASTYLKEVVIRYLTYNGVRKITIGILLIFGPILVVYPLLRE